ncbi:serine/threonine-protein kinase [Legionella steelei]|uniref:Serine/threonine-protein kinase n=1 Tax=Legionella steelei TaxID=947033 RepID=A0A0W0ZGA7_9GAMM|nr:hypothetical protein [Legionella steelei]KTD67994.1 serine/threonine-protein kinase [Legionella steelei]
MLEKAKLFIKEYDDDTYIDNINRDIEKLNRLIDIYNTVPTAEALLQVHQQLLKMDANIGRDIATLAIAGSFRYVPFYQDLSQKIQKELSDLGCPGFSTRQMNQWDIEQCKTNESIPSALLFEKETKPEFFGRIFGAQTSPAIAKATRLLKEINSRIIGEDSEKNYYQLTTLKQSLRELIASETISIEDRATLNNLIAKINNRLFTIVENNPQLRSKVYPSQAASLAQNIDNLSYENLQKITDILSTPAEFNAEVFHDEFDSVIPGLEKYNIKFLGGENAKNYLLTDMETGQRQVLKITPHKGNSRKAYEHIKLTDVKDSITEVYASQQAIQGKHGGYICSLEVTEFCPKGDVLSHGLKMHAKIALIAKDLAGGIEATEQDELQKLYAEFTDNHEVSLEEKQRILAQLRETQFLNAANIYGQMTDIFLRFQANHKFFPDAKPTNFLVNEFDQVFIADTKSFLNTENGLVDPNKIQNEDNYILYTPGFQSPQFEGVEPFSAEKEHSYLMGLSLYCYITGTELSEFPRESKDHPTFMKFDAEVFQSPKGKKFQELIQGLTEPDADRRLNIQQAKDALQAIMARDIKVEDAPFKSKTEAYFFALHNLIELAKTTDNAHIKQAIKEMKILIENHEQNPKKAVHILTSLAAKLENGEQQALLCNIASAIEHSTYEQTPREKYENPLARRFESEMQIALLKSPTDKMMVSVGHVSQAILNVFKQLEEQGFSDILEEFAQKLTSGQEQTGFGSQPEEITIDRVKEILQGNDPKNLNQIMFIHFLFAQKYMRMLPESILPPNRNEPTGKMLELIKEYNDGEYRNNPKAFFDNFDMMKLKFISDHKIYGSQLFTADPSRGREGPLPQTFSSQMGVMLLGQNQEGLDVDRSSWTPDSKYQGVNLDAPFARDLFENDAVYAAGPSGMTSLFMGIMENYGNFTRVDAKQNYLAAVSAYMVSGGLHSLHEVLGPAQYALDLIPGYQVSPPTPAAIAAPPNFHQFYQQQMKLDPQFEDRYQQGWEKVMAAYAQQKDQFVHAPIANISLFEQRVLMSKGSEGPYANLSENEVRAILQQNPELMPANIQLDLTSVDTTKHRETKEHYIKQSLMKINVHYLRGDEQKLEEAISLLFKTVCMTRTNLFKSYSTSTTSAENLVNLISQDEGLRKVFGIHGANPIDWEKEIKTRMEAVCNDESVIAPDFSQRLV